MNKHTVVILGPAIDAVSGVSTHLNQLMRSELASTFRFIHFQVGSEGRSENNISKLKRFLFSPIELALLIARKKPAVLHINTSMDKKAFLRDIIYLFISKAFNINTIYQIHGGSLPIEFFKNRKTFMFLFSLICKLPDAVVVLSKDIQDAYRNFIPDGKLFLIPNAIDLKDYHDCSCKKFDAPILKLVYIGRINYKKGIQDVIKAVGLLKSDRECRNVYFDIAGSGDYENSLRAMVHSLNLENDIKFVGPLFGKLKIEFWKRADIFAFPTFHNEGLPYSILESLASGTPIITTRNKGIGDAIQNDIHGIFVKPHSPMDIAHAIRKMQRDRNDLDIMSANCIYRAKEQYSIGRLARQFKHLYIDTAKLNL